MNKFKVGDVIISEKSAPYTAFKISEIKNGYYVGNRIRDNRKIEGRCDRINKYYNLYIPKYNVGDMLLDYRKKKYRVSEIVMDGFKAYYVLKCIGHMHMWYGENSFRLPRYYVERKGSYKLSQKVGW